MLSKGVNKERLVLFQTGFPHFVFPTTGDLPPHPWKLLNHDDSHIDDGNDKADHWFPQWVINFDGWDTWLIIGGGGSQHSQTFSWHRKSSDTLVGWKSRLEFLHYKGIFWGVNDQPTKPTMFSSIDLTVEQNPKGQVVWAADPHSETQHVSCPPCDDSARKWGQAQQMRAQACSSLCSHWSRPVCHQRWSVWESFSSDTGGEADIRLGTLSVNYLNCFTTAQYWELLQCAQESLHLDNCLQWICCLTAVQMAMIVFHEIISALTPV